MELLVYARNYRPHGADADAVSHRDLGAVVGEPAPAFCWGERLCSFVEVRLPMTVVDPGTEIELLIAKAFAVWGRPGDGRVLRYDNPRGRVSLLLEPGFERKRDLCQALRPVLPRVRELLDRATARVARPRPPVPRFGSLKRSIPVDPERMAGRRPRAFAVPPPPPPPRPR